MIVYKQTWSLYNWLFDKSLYPCNLTHPLHLSKQHIQWRLQQGLRHTEKWPHAETIVGPETQHLQSLRQRVQRFPSQQRALRRGAATLKERARHINTLR